MRQRHHRLDLRAVEPLGRLVLRIRIGLKHPVFGLALCVLIEVLFRRLIKTHNAAFRPRLDRHIGNGHPSFHRHLLQRRPGKLHRFIQCPIGAYACDNRDDHVFAVNAFRKLPVQHNLHRRRHLEPQLSRCNRRGQVRRAYPRAERRKRPIGARVRIRPHNHLPRQNVALLRQKRMTNPRCSQPVVVLDFVPYRPIVQPLVQFGAFYVLGRLKMVRCYHDLLRVEHPVEPLLLQHRNRRWRSNVMTHNHVKPGLDHVPCTYLLFARCGGKYFFRNCHSHLCSISRPFKAPPRTAAAVPCSSSQPSGSSHRRTPWRLPR